MVRLWLAFSSPIHPFPLADFALGNCPLAVLDRLPATDVSMTPGHAVPISLQRRAFLFPLGLFLSSLAAIFLPGVEPFDFLFGHFERVESVLDHGLSRSG